MSEALTIVGLANEQYRLAMDEYKRKRNSFVQAVAYAKEEGASYAEIGRVVGLPRQKVYRLLHGE